MWNTIKCMIAVAIVWFARTVIIILFIEVIHIWLHFFYSEWAYAVSNTIRMKRIYPIWNTQGENDIVRICDIII